MKGVRQQAKTVWNIANDQLYEEKEQIQAEEEKDPSGILVLPSNLDDIVDCGFFNPVEAHGATDKFEVDSYGIKVDASSIREELWHLGWSGLVFEKSIDSEGSLCFFPEEVEISKKENDMNKSHASVEFVKSHSGKCWAP